jgi:SAM-dependent methyltransferase
LGNDLNSTNDKAQGARQKAQGTTQKAQGARHKAEGATQKAQGTRQKAQGATQKAQGTRQKAQGATQKAQGATQKAQGTRQKAQGATGKARGTQTAARSEGWEGWDDYAPFYDWENARTLGRRDVPFWRTLAAKADGLVLELGCGTGRIALPLGRAGAHVVGIDRSEPMLARARQRVRRAKLQPRIQLVRGDIRHLPFRRPFPIVIAPYGILQSLLRERDLAATLRAVHAVLEPGGTFGMELVADLPSWREYRKRVSLTGWRRAAGGSHVTLVETVRQDAARKLTIFDQEFTERRGRARRTHQFSLAFRTLTVPQMARRLEKAGFAVSAVLGDYRGRAWDARADVWIILARKTA